MSIPSNDVVIFVCLFEIVALVIFNKCYPTFGKLKLRYVGRPPEIFNIFLIFFFFFTIVTVKSE